MVRSLLLYALLGIGLPVLLQIQYGYAADVAVMLTLGAGIAAIYMLLPAYLGIVLCFVPMLYNVERHVVSIPGPTDPHFVASGAIVAVILVLVLVARWLQLSRGGVVERGLRAPGVINFRRNLIHGQTDPLTDARLLRQRSAWLIVRPDLQGVDTQAPIKALRVALGGVFLPQTITGRLYQLVPVVSILALTGLLFFVITLGDHGSSRWLHYLFSPDGFVVLRWMFVLVSLMVVMMAIELLTLRWGRPNAELSLLALLPGLNDGHDSKRLLLRAAICLPAIRLGLLLVLGWIGVASLGAGWPVALAMLAIALSCLGYLVAMALGVFGGSPPSGFGKTLLLTGVFVLLSFSMLLPQIWHVWTARSVGQVSATLTAAWIVMLLVLSWLGRRGWHGLQRRPHPFLPN